MLDGESGCGKSALVQVGLVPTLRASGSLLPALVREWGDDWARGPTAACLNALYQALEADDREKIGWQNPPDLASDINQLCAMLEQQLRAVRQVLKRAPLLIGDQFDDYQARHHKRFLDQDDSWLRPDQLMAENPFWKCIGALAREGVLHVLILTRADTAAGCACIRFVPENQTAARTLSRIHNENLRPLLASIAPDDASPAIVSNPENGWQQLREQLEGDLKIEGAVLMQQVQTVLLGVRALPTLTTRAYRAAGGVRGVERLFIERALDQAAIADGGPLTTARRTARTVLNKLVLRPDRNLPPKAHRATWSELCPTPEAGTRIHRILVSLQQNGVIRPAEAGGKLDAWQLAHDYLAKAVIAEARQADRWREFLDDKLRHHREVGHGLWCWWKTLLTTRALARLYWESLRGRLRWEGAAGYAQASLLRPFVQIVFTGILFSLGYNGYAQWRINHRAEALLTQFGTRAGPQAIMELWHERPVVRSRALAAVLSSEADFERADKTAWWPLYASRQQDAELARTARILRIRLQKATNADVRQPLIKAYAAVASRLSDPAELNIGIALAHAELKTAPSLTFGSTPQVLAYSAIAARLSDSAILKNEATLLRAERKATANSALASNLTTAYAAITAQLSDPAALKDEAAALRAELRAIITGTIIDRPASDLVRAYTAIAARLSDPVVLRDEATALRTDLKAAADSALASQFAEAYAGIAARLSDPTVLKNEAVLLRAELQATTSSHLASAFTKAYAAIADRLTDQAAIKDEAAALRAWLKKAVHIDVADAINIFIQTIGALQLDSADRQAAIVALSETKAFPPPKLGLLRLRETNARFFWRRSTLIIDSVSFSI